MITKDIGHAMDESVQILKFDQKVIFAMFESIIGDKFN